MRGTAVTRNGVTEQGIPDTVVGGTPGVDSGGSWIHAGTTPDGKPIITQQLAPEDVALKAYIANNTQGQAGIVYPPVTLPLTKATLPERLPPAPAGTTRVISVVDGVAYYPLVANCPAAACLNGDPVANAIPDSGTQAYLEAVERKVDRTVNIVSGVLGMGGAIVRAGSAVAELATAGMGRAAENMAAAKNTANIAANEIRFSQNSVFYNKVDRATGQPFTYDELVASMRTNGWKGDPVDVVRMPDGLLTSMDNTRITAAREAGIDVRATLQSFDEALTSETQNARGWSNYSTWGEAITGRINNQSRNFGAANPYGASQPPRIKGKP